VFDDGVVSVDVFSPLVEQTAESDDDDERF
jgi:hypothetical protein